MTLSLDRKAFVDIITDGVGHIGGTMLPPPEGVWGMPPEVLKTLPGYDPDVAKNREEAKKIMEKLGYGPNNHLVTKVSTRNMVDEQSMQADPEKRKKIVWQLERMLAETAIRPVIFYPAGGTCRQPWVKGLTIMVNSIYNGWRFEDVWLDK